MVDAVSKFGLTIEQAERTALWEFEIYYESYQRKLLDDSHSRINNAMIMRASKATDKSGKYTYASENNLESAFKLDETLNRINKFYYPDEFYRNNKDTIDEREEKIIAQKRFNEIMKNQH